MQEITLQDKVRNGQLWWPPPTAEYVVPEPIAMPHGEKTEDESDHESDGQCIVALQV